MPPHPLTAYAAAYRRELNEQVIPFWLRHSPDRECGGYFTCLERDGAVYDTRKYMWLQGRGVWMFARLYNEWEKKPEYLEAARVGAAFIRQFGRDAQGRIYFSLDRQGRPCFFQRKPYAAVFVMLGLLEYARATGDAACHDEAVALFWRIVAWIGNPALLERPALPGQRRYSNLANVMVLASMALELAAIERKEEYLRVIREAIAGIARHYDPERRVLLENVPLNKDENLRDWPEGRAFNPGHSIEVVWFLLHLLEYFPDARLRQLALDALDGSLALGWDAEYGGLWYFMDIEGKPVLQPEATMKLWWPHTEALYALVLAHTLTGEARWLTWLERIDAYAHRVFADPAFGEWFGYCDRRGVPTHTCKGGNYKGFFHLPRALLYCIQRLEAAAPRSSGTTDSRVAVRA